MTRETLQALFVFVALDCVAEREHERWLQATRGRAAAMAALVEAAGGLGAAADMVGLSKARVQQLVKQHRANRARAES